MLAAQPAWPQAAIADRGPKRGDCQRARRVEHGHILDERHRLVVAPGGRQRAGVDACEGVAAGHRAGRHCITDGQSDSSSAMA